MSQTPAISVVLPVFNAEAFVRDAVKSILAQTFGDFELIIINDGSTDGSGVILREMAANDLRIVLVERSNAGLVAALNEGIALARGEYIARMDADDVAMPERFALQHAYMHAFPQIAVLGSFIKIIDKSGKFIRNGEYPVSPLATARFLEYGCPLAHPTVMMRKNIVIEVGCYRKAFAHCEDYDLWLRISELGYSIANLPQFLLSYRVHGSNVSAVHRQEQELGSIVARLAHRARNAGLPDPCEGVDSIHAGLIDAVPLDLRKDLEADFFVLRHSSLSLADPIELQAAWNEYQNFDYKTKQHSINCGFLMRLLNGAVRQRIYGIAAVVLIEALIRHPIATFSMLWGKLKTKVTINL